MMLIFLIKGRLLGLKTNDLPSFKSLMNRFSMFSLYTYANKSVLAEVLHVQLNKNRPHLGIYNFSFLIG